jgi:hypothetical protein
MKRTVAALSLILAFSLGCAGLGPSAETLEAAMASTPPPDAGWVGTWQGPGVTFIVTERGDLRYVSEGTDPRSTRGRVSMQVPAKAFVFPVEGDPQSPPEAYIEIGIGPFTQRWTVQQPPYQDGATWRMVLDGVALEKVSDTAELDPNMLHGQP